MTNWIKFLWCSIVTVAPDALDQIRLLDRQRDDAVVREPGEVAARTVHLVLISHAQVVVVDESHFLVSR